MSQLLTEIYAPGRALLYVIEALSVSVSRSSSECLGPGEETAIGRILNLSKQLLSSATPRASQLGWSPRRVAALSQACPHWAHSHPGQTHPTLPLERSHISARRAGLSTRQWGSRGARHPPPPARIPWLFAYRLPDTRLLTHSEPGCGVSSATPSSPSSHTRSHIGDEPPGEVSGRHPGPSASRTGPTRHPPPGLGRQTWFTSAPCKCTWIPCAPTSYQRRAAFLTWVGYF